MIKAPVIPVITVELAENGEIYTLVTTTGAATFRASVTDGINPCPETGSHWPL